MLIHAIDARYVLRCHYTAAADADIFWLALPDCHAITPYYFERHMLPRYKIRRACALPQRRDRRR